MEVKILNITVKDIYIYIYSDIKDIQVIDCLSRMLLNSLFKFLDILIYFKKAVLSVNYQSDSP